jgi:hypothetical protein
VSVSLGLKNAAVSRSSMPAAEQHKQQHSCSPPWQQQAATASTLSSNGSWYRHLRCVSAHALASCLLFHPPACTGTCHLLA